MKDAIDFFQLHPFNFFDKQKTFLQREEEEEKEEERVARMYS